MTRRVPKARSILSRDRRRAARRVRGNDAADRGPRAGGSGIARVAGRDDRGRTLAPDVVIGKSRPDEELAELPQALRGGDRGILVVTRAQLAGKMDDGLRGPPQVAVAISARSSTRTIGAAAEREWRDENASGGSESRRERLPSYDPAPASPMPS